VGVITSTLIHEVCEGLVAINRSYTSILIIICNNTLYRTVVARTCSRILNSILTSSLLATHWVLKKVILVLLLILLLLLID
jgi:hypothetical protein